MAKVSNGVETLPKILIAWVGRKNVTDDRQTDGRAMTYSEREGEFTFAKKELWWKEQCSEIEIWTGKENKLSL